MKRFWLLLLILSFLVPACGGKKKVEEIPKGVVKVERRTVRKVVLATGAVKPKVGAMVKVGSRISGKLEKLLVQAGDQVKEGQLIAVVEHKDLQARVERLEATLRGLRIRKKNVLAQTSQQLRELAAKLSLARLELKRLRSLYAKNYVSLDAVDQAQRDVKVLEAQLSATRENYASLEAQYDQDIAQTLADLKEARVRLSWAFIHAPISGTVSSVTTQQGETVVAGLNAPTFITIINLARLQVDGFVDETDIGQVKSGQDVTFTVDAFPSKVFRGRVNTVYPGAVVRDNVVYYDVAVEILDPYVGYLRPEMTANLTIIAGVRKNVLAVPDKSLRMDLQGRSYVMVKRGEKWEKRYVTTGWSSDGYTQILQGVKEGEEVGVW
ncbi:MAG: efflux RND transporter periplasmic adaptor subunit [Aquificota bacterium]|nr:MAG: efflux RND transporter periplasmic adaptor subunit [Aquificota bacterium]